MITCFKSIVALVGGCLAAVACAAADDVVITMIDGSTLTAELRAIGSQKVTFVQNGIQSERRVIEIASISGIRQRSVDASGKIILKLMGGSLVSVDQLQLEDQQYRGMSSERKVLLNSRNVDWVKLRSATNEKEQADWEDVQSRRSGQGDMLVIKRDESLDWLEGVVVALDENRLAFAYNERDVEIKLEKIEGFFLYHAEGRRFPDPECIVKTTNGSSIHAKSIELSGKEIVATTVCGETIPLTSAEVVLFDFMFGREQFLAELVPSFSDWQPLLASTAELEMLKKMNRPRFNQGFGNQSLELRVEDETDANVMQVRRFDSGIALRGGSRLVYSLSGKYKWLLAQVGFPPAANANGSIRLRILGDGKVLWEKVLKKNEIESFPMKVEIEGVQRLTIETDYFDGRAIGDTLHLCDIKVSK